MEFSQPLLDAQPLEVNAQVVEEAQPLTPFEKSVKNVVTATITVQDLAKTLVTGAVADVIARIADDYGLDETEVREKFLADVVDMHAGIAGCSAQKKCCFVARRSKKPCSKFAVMGDYCHWHKEEGLERQEKRRRVEAYKASVSQLPLTQVPPSQDVSN